MLRYKKLGQVIDVNIPKSCGHSDFIAECQYKYDKNVEKYSLRMWLKRKNIDDRFKIDSQEIDTQYISGTRETIIDNICRIVEQAAHTGFFEPYIARYIYTYECFDKGDDFYESERMRLNAQ